MVNAFNAGDRHEISGVPPGNASILATSAGNIPSNASVRGTAAGNTPTNSSVRAASAGNTPASAGVYAVNAGNIPANASVRATNAGVILTNASAKMAEVAENEGIARNTAFFAKNRVPVKKSQFDGLGFKTPNEAYY